ncbi:MAG TPA: LamG domain-containing protein [Thermoleophilaceae bacterium]
MGRARVVIATAIACALPAAAPAAASASPAPTPVTGTSSAFADSIGINAADFYPDTLYANHPLVKQLLLDLGVKHLRGGIRMGRSSQEYANVRDLAAAGLKKMWITGRPGSQWGDPERVDQVRDILTDPNRLGGTTEALEGPNEFDGTASQDPLWADKLFTFQAQTYTWANSDSQFASMPFYGPSFLSDSGRDTYAAKPGASTFMDAPTGHPYAGGRQPEDVLASQVAIYASKFGNRKPVISETGYHTAINGGNWWHYGVSERAQSIYLMRTVLTAFALGVPRTYIYQLLDLKPNPAKDDLEMHFGIVATEGDPAQSAQPTWTARPKQAYDSLKELFELTSSSATHDGGPARLSYSLSGAPSTLQKVLLSRRDGSVDLVLWNKLPVYNDRSYDCNDPRVQQYPAQDRCFWAMLLYSEDEGDAFPADVPVTLTLGDRARVSTERPHSQTSFTSLGEGTTFNLSVGADPVFVRIEPRYAMAVRADEPSAWLRLGEASGAPADSAGRGATTTAWTSAPTHGRTGAVGDGDTAVGVSGSQRATVNLASPVSTEAGATVEMWVKPDLTTPDFTEFLTSNSPDVRGRMRVYNRHDGRDWGSTYGSRPGATGEMIFDSFDWGQWHHVVLTMAAGRSITYLDGEKVGETTGGEALNLSAFTVGANGGNGGFKGDVDELAVYPSALSAGRVCAHYRAGGGSC